MMRGKLHLMPSCEDCVFLNFPYEHGRFNSPIPKSQPLHHQLKKKRPAGPHKSCIVMIVLMMLKISAALHLEKAPCKANMAHERGYGTILDGMCDTRTSRVGIKAAVAARRRHLGSNARAA
jgi:hypothetical protein